APSRTCVKTQVAPLTSETIAEETVTLNADGLPLERQRLLHRGTGEDLAISYVYDSAGRLATERWDANANGIMTDAVTYTYDQIGRLIETRRTNGAPRVTKQTWLGPDRLSIHEIDRDGDGAWDERVSLTFDAAGHPLTRRFDRASDDLFDADTTYVYDGDLRIREIETSGGNTRTLTYTYDGRAREVAVREVLDGENVVGGPLIRTFRRLYAGERLIHAAWFDQAGVWVEGSRYHYDTQERVIAIVWDSTLDGVEEREFRWNDDDLLIQRDFRYRDVADSTKRTTFTAACGIDTPMGEGP
ncbi:MAG: YD repeat-containing protein, partial [Myxococcota bacterium]